MSRAVKKGHNGDGFVLEGADVGIDRHATTEGDTEIFECRGELEWCDSKGDLRRYAPEVTLKFPYHRFGCGQEESVSLEPTGNDVYGSLGLAFYFRRIIPLYDNVQDVGVRDVGAVRRRQLAEKGIK